MRPALRFDFEALLADAQLEFGDGVDGVEISLPFVSVRVAPREVERLVANQIAVRIAHRRFLHRDDCCTQCRASALSSLHEIQRMLEWQQGGLANATHGSLFVLIELMLEGIRQFTAFEAALGTLPAADAHSAQMPAARWSCANRRACFSAMELLRAHLCCCLRQVEAIAQVRIASVRDQSVVEHAWQLESYRPPRTSAALTEPAWSAD